VPEKTTAQQQVKSKKRVADYGEVFTREREVKAMLDLVKPETQRIESRFLEPACGNGNFLAEVLHRKLQVVDNRYAKNQLEWEFYAVVAVSGIYGVDIMEDNTSECRERLYNIFADRYTGVFKNKIKEACCKSVRFLLNRNILWGDALDFTHPHSKEPIIFSEWSPVNSSMLKRRDYVFRFLVEKTHQFTLFNDQGQIAAIDEPVKEFPIIHFLELGSESGI
jgi:hypothetical protein